MKKEKKRTSFDNNASNGIRTSNRTSSNLLLHIYKKSQGEVPTTPKKKNNNTIAKAIHTSTKEESSDIRVR
jgi:hypothetical protein